MIDNFDVWYPFNMRPENDGQPDHTTPGDLGGETVYGWTWKVWSVVAPLHGVYPADLGTFRQQTPETLKPLARAQYWNVVQGDHLPPGVDVFWADFGFGSGGATKVLQKVLGVTPDGHVGFAETIPAVQARSGDLAGLLAEFLNARIAYYDACGFHQRWPGLYKRAQACHLLALHLVPASGFAAPASVSA